MITSCPPADGCASLRATCVSTAATDVSVSAIFCCELSEIKVSVGVGVGVGLKVRDGVSVRAAVGDGVCVFVGVTVDISVSLELGAADAVRVGAAVFVEGGGRTAAAWSVKAATTAVTVSSSPSGEGGMRVGDRGRLESALTAVGSALNAAGGVGDGAVIGLKDNSVGTADNVKTSRRALAVAVKADGGVTVLGAIKMPYNASSVSTAVRRAPKAKAPRDKPFSEVYCSISLKSSGSGRGIESCCSKAATRLKPARTASISAGL
jgi:hypothetical protein